MIAGFTGTSRGTTQEQWETLRSLLRHPSVSRLHHGDCIGADAEAHAIMEVAGKPVEIHPPLNPYKRASCISSHPESVLHPEKEFHDRNHDIVDQSEVLIATPHGPERSSGGKIIPYLGEWSTIRYARKQGKPIRIIWPDGSTTREPGREV